MAGARVAAQGAPGRVAQPVGTSGDRVQRPDPSSGGGLRYMLRLLGPGRRGNGRDERDGVGPSRALPPLPRASIMAGPMCGLESSEVGVVADARHIVFDVDIGTGEQGGDLQVATSSSGGLREDALTGVHGRRVGVPEDQAFERGQLLVFDVERNVEISPKDRMDQVREDLEVERRGNGVPSWSGGRRDVGDSRFRRWGWRRWTWPNESTQPREEPPPHPTHQPMMPELEPLRPGQAVEPTV